MNLPTHRQLQYFLALMETHHFGRAAELCFATQSTLSTGIQELENLLGQALFERNKRKVSPTSLAITLEPKAREILELSTAFAQSAQQTAPLSGTLRLGVIPTIGPFFLPKCLPSLRRKYKDLRLQLVEDQSAHIVDKLNQGQLDCAVIALPFATGTLQTEILTSESFWVAMPKHHELAKQNSIPAVALPEDQLLLLEEGHCLRDHALAVCKNKSPHLQTAFYGTSLYTLMEMVAGGLGMTFLPEMAIDSSIAKNRAIVLRKLAEQGPHRDIALIWRKTYPRQEEMQLLAKELKALATK